MPRVPRVRIESLAEFAAGMKFLPRAAARRQLLRAERLAEQVLADLAPVAGRSPSGLAYPRAWVMEQLTGYKADTAARGARSETVMLPGDALLGDLAALIERLCRAAEITEAELLNGTGTGECTGAWGTLDELAAAWRVSRKSLERYRRMGLITRRAKGPRGRETILVRENAARAFAAARPELLKGAAGFSRIHEDERDRMIHRAFMYRRRLGWPMTRTAQRLSERFGRSREAVRRVLMKHDSDAKTPIFGRARRAADAASASGAHRLESAGRLRVLRAAIGDGSVLTLEEEKQASEALRSIAARTGLGRAGPGTLAEMLRLASTMGAPIGAIEKQRSLAIVALRLRARRIAADLNPNSPRVTGPHGLDRAETDLRWASRLKAELVRDQLPLMLRSIRAATGRGVEEESPSEARVLISACVEAVIAAVSSHDSFGGGRLAAPVGLAVTHVVTLWMKGRKHGAAREVSGRGVQARMDPRSIALEDFTRRVDEWQALVDADAGLREGLQGMDERSRRVISLRNGWASEEDTDEVAGPPRTLEETAKAMGISRMMAARVERRAREAAAR